MIIWVAKDAVHTLDDQRAVVQAVHGSDIDIRLLDDNREFTIRPQDVVGIEIGEHLTIKFNSNSHCIRE